MSTYEVDSERNIVFSKFTGTLDLDVLSSHIDHVVQDEAFREEMNTLVDLGEAVITMSIKELAALRKVLSVQESRTETTKWAVVTSSATINALINLTVPLIGMEKATIRAFDYRDSALEWLES